MVKKGKFKLAEQIRTTGFYAEVAVEITVDPRSTKCTVQAASEDVVYKEAAIFGALYALGMLSGGFNCNELCVRIVEVRWFPVDTTDITVAYAAAFAVWNALGYKPDNPPNLNKETMSFVFPKGFHKLR